MSVSTPFNTAYGSLNNGAADKDITLTINSGNTDVVLIVWVGWANQAAVTISSVTWDPAGANQTLTSVNAEAVNGNYKKQAFYRINPTPGTTKTLRVTMSTGTIANVNIGAAAYGGAHQTTPTGNWTSNTTGDALTVTATSGDATTTSIITSNTVDSTDKTEIWRDSTPSASADGGDYALASGNVTHTWGESGDTRVMGGFAILQSVGGDLNVALSGSAGTGGHGISVPNFEIPL